MKLLRELYDILSYHLSYDEKDWNTFRGGLNGDFKRRFFDLFEQGHSEREIIYALFKTKKATNPYRNVKSDVKVALEKEILKFEPPAYHYSRFQIAQYNAAKQHAILTYLVGLGSYQLVIDFGERLIKVAIYYDLTGIVVDVSRRLFLYYAKRELDYARVDHYSEINDKYSAILQLELEVERLASKMTSLIDEGLASHQSIIEIAEDYLEGNPMPKIQIPSERYYSQYYSIKVYLNELYGDYREVKEVAAEAYNLFCEKEYEHIYAKRIFLIHIIYAQLRIDCRNVSFNYINSALELCRKGDVHWFDAMEFKVRASISSDAYTQAHQCYQAMIDHRSFKHQPSHSKIRWMLLGTYIQFLRKIDLIPGEDPTGQFINKHFKFLEENETQLKEMKVPFIISKLLYSIYDRDYISMEEKIYSLKNYCNVYLKRDTPNYRSHCFIKMLLTIPQYHFNPQMVERRVGHYIRKMGSASFEIDNARVVEIIAYEELWAIIMKYLEKPKRKRRSDYTFGDWTIGRKKL